MFGKVLSTPLINMDEVFTIQRATVCAASTEGLILFLSVMPKTKRFYRTFSRIFTSFYKELLSTISIDGCSEAPFAKNGFHIEISCLMSCVN